MGSTAQSIMQILAYAILLNNDQSNLTDTHTNCQPNNITKDKAIGNNKIKVKHKMWLPKFYLPLDPNGI